VHVAFAATPRPAPLGPRELERRADAKDESLEDAIRTNKQADTNATRVSTPATKTAGPTFGQEVPWPDAGSSGPNGTGGPAPQKPYKFTK
jgi:hypothetical protein